MHHILTSRDFSVVLLAAVLSSAAHRAARADEWRQYADVEQAGWSAAKLEDARRLAATIGSAAVMIVDHGHVVAAWGAVDHPYKTASMRKSLYDATIGATHYASPFDVNTEIGKLKIDDLNPLTDQEKRATFEQLLTARSGVYHPAAYETRSNAKRRPKRGSATPGSLWYYNNWDFNVLCAAFEQLSGEPIQEAFARRVAQPLDMEDFKPSHVFEWLEPRNSAHPAITFRLSARDLARVGKLYLQDGRWGDQQIVSADWVKRSTEPHTTFEPGHYRGEGNGYGRLWWIFPARPERNSPYQAHHRVAARGKGGQIMVLFPGLDVLVVHRADTDSGRGVSGRDGIKLLDMIMGARKGEPASNAKLGPVRVAELSGRSPTPLRTDLSAVPEARRNALEGRYAFSEDDGIRLYQFDDRLFAQLLGVPLPAAEMFQASDGSLRSPNVSVVIESIEATDGSVEAVRMSFRGRTRKGKRVE